MCLWTTEGLSHDIWEHMYHTYRRQQGSQTGQQYTESRTYDCNKKGWVYAERILQAIQDNLLLTFSRFSPNG